MPTRYDHKNTIIKKVVKLDDGRDVTRRRFASRIYPHIKEREGDKYIITRDGDRLDLLSEEFFGLPDFWWYIAAANNIMTPSYVLEAGVRLRIPNLVEYYEAIEEIEKYNTYGR